MSELLELLKKATEILEKEKVKRAISRTLKDHWQNISWERQ